MSRFYSLRGDGPRHLVNAAAAFSYLHKRFGTTEINWKASRWIAVYPSLGLAYNRIQKNANTSAMVLLRDLEQGDIEHQRTAKKTTLTLFDFGPRRKHIPQDLTYFVIIRNPYSRVLSAFLNKFKPNSRISKEHGAFDHTADGFKKFVYYLRDGGRSGNSHWDLQKKLMLLPPDQYDRVIRFENFQEEMLGFLESRGLAPRAGSLEALYPSDQNKKTDATKKMERFYTREVADLVADLFAADFDTLGYDRTFPGTLED